MDKVKEDEYIWLPMKTYCKLKNITRKTCWQQRKDKKLIYRTEKNKIFIAIEKNSCFINNKNEYFIFNTQL